MSINNDGNMIANIVASGSTVDTIIFDLYSDILNAGLDATTRYYVREDNKTYVADVAYVGKPVSSTINYLVQNSIIVDVCSGGGSMFKLPNTDTGDMLIDGEDGEAIDPEEPIEPEDVVKTPKKSNKPRKTKK